MRLPPLTLGDALRAEHAGIDAAIRRRNDLVRLALERGATTRSVARHLGVSKSTVQRWATAGVDRSQPDVDPFLTPAPERAQ